MDLYSENIIHHYKNPQHYGKLENPTVSAMEYNPLCGDKIQMDFQFGSDQKVKDIAFSGTGCAISQASASMLTEKLIGKTMKGIKKIRNDEIFEMLGVPISPGRVKCALLALICAKKAIISEEHGVVVQ